MPQLLELKEIDSALWARIGEIGDEPDFPSGCSIWTPDEAKAAKKEAALAAAIEWADERDRLKALNAELVTALEQLARLGKEGMKPDPAEWITFHDKVAQIARAALDKARE